MDFPEAAYVLTISGNSLVVGDIFSSQVVGRVAQRYIVSADRIVPYVDPYTIDDNPYS